MGQAFDKVTPFSSPEQQLIRVCAFSERTFGFFKTDVYLQSSYGTGGVNANALRKTCDDANSAALVCCHLQSAALVYTIGWSFRAGCSCGSMRSYSFECKNGSWISIALQSVD